MQEQHVVVVGAGIAGACAAHALARSGVAVTLLDAAAEPGQLTSKANGAQLSYNYVEPMATPDALKLLPRWLLNADSPVRWHPRADWGHVQWLASFVRHCNWARVQTSTRTLLALAELSRQTLAQWLDDAGPARESLHYQAPGKLVLYPRRAEAHVRQQLAWQSECGSQQSVVDRQQCLELEPALQDSQGPHWDFGVWTVQEAVVDCAALVRHLVRQPGIAWRPNARVVSMQRRGERIQSVTLDSGEVIATPQLVVACGPVMNQLLGTVGLHLPIEPIKGYSITVRVEDGHYAPAVSVTDSQLKMVFARLGESMRVAGFAELTGMDMAIDPGRIRTLARALQQHYPRAFPTLDAERGDMAAWQPWCGLRPATPSALPLVGRLRFDNLWVHGGHGALGLTLSAGSARLLAQMLSGQQPLALDPSPFASA